MWFSSWSDIGRVVVSAVLTYVLLIAALRVSGKRTISSMNVSDFVVTIALGSGVATAVLDTQLALTTAFAGLAMLVLLQFVTSWLTTRSELARKTVEASPTLLVYRGHTLQDTLRRQNINESEILHAVREKGGSSVEDAYAVVLEIDGRISVLFGAPQSGRESVLKNVAGRPH